MANLVTSPRVKTVIAQAVFTATEDALVASLCAVVSAAARSFTRRDLDPGLYEETVSGPGSNRLLLRHYPVIAVTSVTDLRSQSGVSAYEIERARGVLWKKTGWARGERNYRVFYTAGYDPLPEDLVDACAQWAAALFHQSKENPAESPTLPPLAIRQALSPYRRRSF